MIIRNAIRHLHPNPDIEPHESVLFFPTDAHLAGGLWHIPVHGWIYRPTRLSRLRRTGLWLLQRALWRRLTNPEAKSLFEVRAGAFLSDNARWERVKIQIGDAIFHMKRSHANGHFTGTATIAQGPTTTAWLLFQALTPAVDKRTFKGTSRLLPPEGLSVISDIDDTIKVTQVSSRRKMLRNTFARDFVCVPDIAALYRRWASDNGAAFHYISASPWHLYPFLDEFLQAQDFPRGTFYLRYFRLMPTDLRRTFRAGWRVKYGHARDLFRRFPRRQFRLVGDSGESDPALYAKLYREFPNQVEQILIRDVARETRDRVGRALRSVPKAHWRLFQSPKELA